MPQMTYKFSRIYDLVNDGETEFGLCKQHMESISDARKNAISVFWASLKFQSRFRDDVHVSSIA